MASVNGLVVENKKHRPILGAILLTFGIILFCPSMLFLLAALWVGEFWFGLLVSAPGIVLGIFLCRIGRRYRPQKSKPEIISPAKVPEHVEVLKTTSEPVLVSPFVPTAPVVPEAPASCPVAPVVAAASVAETPVQPAPTSTPVPETPKSKLFTISQTQKSEKEEKKSVPVVSDYKQRRAAFIESKKVLFDSNLAQIPRVPITLTESKTKRANMINMPEIKYSNITRQTNFDKLFPFVVVDTETTGLKPGGNDIIEISAIKYGPGYEAISCFTTLCKPRKPIPAEAAAVNNITNEMVADAPAFGFVAPAFSEYIAGCNVVGHNLPFDLRFLYISGVDLPLKLKFYDTLELAKKVLTKYGSKKYNHKTKEYEESDEWDVYDYKLETLCEYYDIYRNDAHRSLSDCYATGLLFKNLIEDKTS